MKAFGFERAETPAAAAAAALPDWASFQVADMTDDGDGEIRLSVTYYPPKDYDPATEDHWGGFEDPAPSGGGVGDWGVDHAGEEYACDTVAWHFEDGSLK